MKKDADIIIVGTGVAGLFCALSLPQEKDILMITKSKSRESDSFLAQGGICVLKDAEDYESFLEDTLKAGHYENDLSAVHQMIIQSPQIISELLRYGVAFEQEQGSLKYTREGAHSKARILYHQDVTGKEITEKLLEQVNRRPNIRLLEETQLLDLIVSRKQCTGIVTVTRDGIIYRMDADYVVLATGGIGGLYQDSTNYPHLTGDSLALALKHGIELQNMNYVQIHPTTLYSEKKGRRFLISESVRGEGAYLYNGKMERFTDELLPRDLLTKAIYQQMDREGSRHVWLSLTHLDASLIRERFPNIYERCLEEGIDITREYIPVVPAQHYFMGGIRVDLASRTSLKHLYAIGETSCNGVHGANRLASNSLLESLVFARRAALHISSNYAENQSRPLVDMSMYRNPEQLQKEYREIVCKAIERSSKHDRQYSTGFQCG